MSFMKSAAAVHAVEQIFAELDAVLERARSPLANLPEPLRTEAIQEIKQKVSQLNPSEPDFRNQFGPIEHDLPNTTKPSATQAILNLLKQSDGPLAAEEIQNSLRGKFQTSAEVPDRVISSTLSQLRGNGRILLNDGRYSILKTLDIEDEDTSLKERIVAYFKSVQNKPTNTTDLATKVNAHPNALRSIFSTYKGTLFEQTGDVEKGGFKLWRLIQETGDEF